MNAPHISLLIILLGVLRVSWFACMSSRDIRFVSHHLPMSKLVGGLPGEAVPLHEKKVSNLLSCNFFLSLSILY